MLAWDTPNKLLSNILARFDCLRATAHSCSMSVQTTNKLNITEREVNARYGLGLRHLRIMRMRGDGPRWIKTSGQGGRRGGRVEYPVDALARWIARRPCGGGETACKS